MANNNPLELLDLLKKQLTKNSASTFDAKAVASALRGSRKLLDKAILLLEGKPETEAGAAVDEEPIVKDPEAPYGRKKNGIPKKAPGRAAQSNPVA